jgi:hypothetical protein
MSFLQLSFLFCEVTAMSHQQPEVVKFYMPRRVPYANGICARGAVRLSEYIIRRVRNELIGKSRSLQGEIYVAVVLQPANYRLSRRGIRFYASGKVRLADTAEEEWFRALVHPMVQLKRFEHMVVRPVMLVGNAERRAEILQTIPEMGQPRRRPHLHPKKKGGAGKAKKERSR